MCGTSLYGGRVDSSILVIIPAYNEEDSLSSVIDSVRVNAPFADIVVVNDGSIDATPSIARAKGVMLLDLPYNLGIGGAVQTGYKFAEEQGYGVAVQVDGDGQHPAAAVPELVRRLQARQAEDDGKTAEALRALVPPGATMAQLALRWILSFDAVTCAIPGAKTPDQARDNTAAVDLPALDAATMDAVRKVYDEHIRAHVHGSW